MSGVDEHVTLSTIDTGASAALPLTGSFCSVMCPHSGWHASCLYSGCDASSQFVGRLCGESQPGGSRYGDVLILAAILQSALPPTEDRGRGTSQKTTRRMHAI